MFSKGSTSVFYEQSYDKDVLLTLEIMLFIEGTLEKNM